MYAEDDDDADEHGNLSGFVVPDDDDEPRPRRRDHSTRDLAGAEQMFVFIWVLIKRLVDLFAQLSSP